MQPAITRLGFRIIRLAPARYHVTLFGSLAWTGKGHGTDSAILLGLTGQEPETVDPDQIDGLVAAAGEMGTIDIDFNYERELERHTNGMRFAAFDDGGALIVEEDWYSLGGGFVARGDEPEPGSRTGEPPFTFSTSESLLKIAADNNLSIAELVLRNETTWQGETAVSEGLDGIWAAMCSCIDRGLRTEGVLPGRLSVTRPALKLCLASRHRRTARPASSRPS